MALIDQLTKTHAELDHELDRFRRLLEEVVEGEDPRGAAKTLKTELEAIQHKLDLHLESEARLEKRSDRILGEGSMDEVSGHHDDLRIAIQDLHTRLSDDGDFVDVHQHFLVFLEHFERYTRAEWEYLQATSSVLYPGGATD